MCNLYRLHKGPDAIRAIFDGLQLPLTLPEGIPNLEPRDVRITDPAPIVRANPASGALELVVRRWSWPGSGGKPLYNYRSDNRQFPSGRCLIIADGFYEYTPPADPRQKRKDRWLFTVADGGLIGIGGIVRQAPDVGEAFTMLTAQPGPDIAPLHHRQPVLIPPAHWNHWLTSRTPASELLRPSLEGTLTVTSANLA